MTFLNPKVVQISSSDRIGGAAIAALRLHEGLLRTGTTSRLLVGRKVSQSPRVVQARAIPGYPEIFRHMAGLHNRIWLMLGGGYHSFRPGFPLVPGWSPHVASDEIVHVHWIADGFVPFRALEGTRGRLVLTFHDMWPFTGGCHHSRQCDGFTDGCHGCPLLPPRLTSIPPRIWESRRRFFQESRPVVICPSAWMAERFAKTPMAAFAEVRIIPNPLDIEVFRPRDRRASRARMGLPPESTILCFSAFDTSIPLKGWMQLREALVRIAQLRPETRLLVLGRTPVDFQRECPLETTLAGSLSDEEHIATALSASDLFVLPSLEENFPNTVAESLACGTPCASFAIGGVPEMVVEGSTGSLAEPGSPESLAQAILRTLDAGASLSPACRVRAETRCGPAALDAIRSIYRDLERGAR